MPTKPPPTPQNWPPTLPYLTATQLSPSLLPSTIHHLHTAPDDTTFRIPRTHSSTPSTSIRISAITNPSHPANCQSGLFATKALSPGTFILPYLGIIHQSPPPEEETHPTTTTTTTTTKCTQPPDPHATSNYDLSLSRDPNLGIDAATHGNEARFINDYRGVPGVTHPNAEFREVWDERIGRRGMGVFVLPGGRVRVKCKVKVKDGGERERRKNGSGVFKGVGKGEEILVSYGRGFWGARREDEGAERRGDMGDE